MSPPDVPAPRLLRRLDGARGDLLELAWESGPGWDPVPLHRHEHGDERIEVVAGALLVVVDGILRRYRSGESLIVPGGAVHTLLPSHGDGVALRWQRPERDWSTTRSPRRLQGRS